MRTPLMIGLLLLPLTAWPQAGEQDATKYATPPGDATEDMRDNPRLTDELFIKKAAQANLAEIQAARKAMEKGSNREVKEFAQRMIQDHTQANAQIKELAVSVDVTMPTQMDMKQQTAMSKLDGLSGEEFDEAYTEQMIKDHKETVGLFEQAANAKTLSPEARQLAGKLLPKLREHEQSAEQLESEID